MTLHPQAAAHLAAAAEAPPIHTLDVAGARAAGLGYLQLQRAPRAMTVEHRFVPGPTADLPVRIYRPDGAVPGGPVVLMLHGSGWVICNLDVCDEPARALADDSGLVVITVNYQKAPEHPYPRPLDDCVAAFEWIRAQSVALGVDADRIAAVGDSAGGNLAAGLALRLRDTGRPGPAALALLYPALEQVSSDDPTGDGLSRADMAWFWNHYLAGTTPDSYAAPGTAPELTGLPPTFVATAEHDVLRADGERFAARLAAAGVAVTRSDYPGMIHGFYWMDGVLDDAVRLQLELADWLRSALLT